MWTLPANPGRRQPWHEHGHCGFPGHEYPQARHVVCPLMRQIRRNKVVIIVHLPVRSLAALCVTDDAQDESLQSWVITISSFTESQYESHTGHSLYFGSHAGH